MSDAPEQRITELEAALASALSERNELWAERNQRLAAEAELERARARVDQMEGSVSWRLTTPLRAARARLLFARHVTRRLRALANR